MTLAVGVAWTGSWWVGPGPAAKVNGGGLTGPLAKLTGVEVAIGAEPADTAVLVVLIAGSVGVTAVSRPWSEDVVDRWYDRWDGVARGSCGDAVTGVTETE